MTKNKEDDSKISEKNWFSKREILKSMSRQLFVFIGILSHSTFGDDYLTEKKFYSLMKMGLNHGSKFDYLFTLLVDNINFNSKGAIELITEIVNIGSKRMKRYVFEHVRCLMKFGKQIEWDISTFLRCMKNDPEVSRILAHVLFTLMDDPANIRTFAKALDSVDLVRKEKKELLYLALREPSAIEKFSDFVDSELTEMKIESIVDSYAEKLEENYMDLFPLEDNRSDRYFLSINLPKVSSVYDNYAEYFWIKQLPFNFNFGILNNTNKENNFQMLNAYLEYHSTNKILLYASLKDEVKVDIKNQSIKFICMIGDSTVDKSCRLMSPAEFLNFEPADFKNISIFSKDNSNEKFFRVEKEGVVINFKKEMYSESQTELVLYSIYAYVQICPCRFEFN